MSENYEAPFQVKTEITLGNDTDTINEFEKVFNILFPRNNRYSIVAKNIFDDSAFITIGCSARLSTTDYNYLTAHFGGMVVAIGQMLKNREAE